MKLLITTQVIDTQDPILGFFHGWVLEFAKHFSEIHIICLKKGVYDFPPHVHVYSLGKEDGESRIKYTFRFYRFFIHIFFKVRVDYVFFHMGAIYNILAAPFFAIRTFFGTQFYWWKAHGRINYFGRFALNFVDRVYTSTATGFSINTAKRRIVGQAIDTTLFSFSDLDRKKEIIFVGRIVPIKKLEDFIDTAHILYTSGYDGVCTIIGPSFDDSSYKKALENRIQEYGLEGKVMIIPPKVGRDLIEHYRQATIFLNTSRTESMDKTVLEAMLCGCVPVTANSAFTDMLTQDNLYIKDATPIMYAKRIQEILISSEIAHLQANLREYVVRKHSLDTFPERIFKITL